MYSFFVAIVHVLAVCINRPVYTLDPGEASSEKPQSIDDDGN